MATEYGDRDWATTHEILRTTVGSEVHGIHFPGTEDHDEMGIYIERPESLLGFDPTLGMDDQQRQDYFYRTKGEGERSSVGDTDLIIYGLRKFCGLAVKGNPTILLPLYAPSDMILKRTYDGEGLREIRDAFISKNTVERVLRYSNAQRTRMMGSGKHNKMPNRPELIEKYGWDTKYGSHALRLVYQAWEIVTTGGLTLPMPSTERQHVLAVKLGQFEKEQVNDQILQLMDETRYVLKSSPLPPEADTSRVIKWMTETQLNYWHDHLHITGCPLPEKHDWSI